MSKNETDANTYRADRKKRLSKNTRQSGIDSVKVVTVIVSILATLAVLALVIFGLYQFGIPQKFMPAVKVDGKTYSVAEYGFYYSSVYQSLSQKSQTGDASAVDLSKTVTDEDGNKTTYDELIRKNVKKSLETQNYYLKKCKEENVTLSDEKKAEIDKTIADIAQYAKQYSYSTSRYISLIYGKGINEKMFRSLLENQFLVAQYIDSQQKDCFDNISEKELEKAYSKNAAKYQAVDIRLFGFEKDPEPAPTETTTAAAEQTTAAAEQTTAAAEQTTAAAEQTTAAQEETTAAKKEEPKEPSKQELLAKEMLGKITDEKSFNKLAQEYADAKDKAQFKKDDATLLKNIKQSLVETNIGKDIADWLYSSERVAGDKNTYTAKDFVYVIYVVRPAYRNEEPLVDARHILVSFEEVAKRLKEKNDGKIDVEQNEDREVKTSKANDNTEITNKGTGYSIELVTETYKAAHEIYEEYLKGEKTEEAFAQLANDRSADKTSAEGQNANGGLYENIERGKMVKPFEDWVYAAERKPGNVGIVMTNYGWHVIYFVKKHDEPAWKEDVRSSLGTEAFEAIEKDIEKNSEGSAADAAFAKFAGNEAGKLMTKLYAKKNG